MFAARQRLHASLDGLVRAHCAPMGAICATRVAHGLRMAPMGILRPMIAAMGEMSFWVDVSVFQDRPVNGWRTAEAVTISNAADRGSEIKPRLDLAVDDDAGGHEPEPLVERSWSARSVNPRQQQGIATICSQLVGEQPDGPATHAATLVASIDQEPPQVWQRLTG